MVTPFNMGTPEDLDLELAQQVHDQRLIEWLDEQDRLEEERSKQSPTPEPPKQS